MTEASGHKKADRRAKKARFEKSSKQVDDSPKTKTAAKGKEKAKQTDDKSAPPATALPASFKVVAGSYEKLLYGLEGTASSSENGYELSLRPIFIFPAHVSCIKAVAASPGGKWLATGSADEIIKVWDLARRKEVGGLMHHEGSITHLQFPSRSHLLSASEDGTLCLFHARDWAVLRTFKGHKGRVNSVAVHPSGKVALSVGQDRTLRMWDMMRGKGSASTKLGKGTPISSLAAGLAVTLFVRGGGRAVVARRVVFRRAVPFVPRDLFDGALPSSQALPVRFCKPINGAGELMLVAAEDKKVSVYQFSDDPEKPPSIVAETVGHSNRIKAVETLEIAVPPPSHKTKDARTSTTIVCTISSDGKILVYDLATLAADAEERQQLQPVAEYDTKGTRLTCLTVSENKSAPEAHDGSVTGSKRKRSGGEGGSGEEAEADQDEEDEWEPHFDHPE
ncbi:hypothetical protein ID866_4919 [Astraeus odoratus]|nr:hypothetical protein ID866_4919 [Astraeus odoratus]